MRCTQMQGMHYNAGFAEAVVIWLGWKTWVATVFVTASVVYV